MNSNVPMYGFGGGDGAADMRDIADAFAKLPPGQPKKVLTGEIIAILKKYGVSINGN